MFKGGFAFFELGSFSRFVFLKRGGWTQTQRQKNNMKNRILTEDNEDNEAQEFTICDIRFTPILLKLVSFVSFVLFC
jgi:hypothetical protein